MWCVAELTDEYIARMEDVLETYERPYNQAHPVVCLDEKPVTLHADVRPPRPAGSGREARYDSEYERRGTANVFCAVEPKAGRHFTFVTPDRSGVEFAKALFEVAMAYPEAETIHLVMDNLSTHSHKSLADLCGDEFGREIWSCFTPHYTPVHGSWLNQAEIEIGLFSRQCLGKRRNHIIWGPRIVNPDNARDAEVKTMLYGGFKFNIFAPVSTDRTRSW